MNRRTMLGGLLGSAVAISPGRILRAQTEQRPELAGCLAEPGIALFLDLFEGQQTLTLQELVPPADWLPFSLPYSPVWFLYPPDWSAQLLYAATFTQNAAPIWISNVPQTGGLLSARVVSPDATSAWEYAVGSLQGVVISIEQAIAIAEGGMLGDGYAGSRLCFSTGPAIPTGIAWLTAIDSNGLLALTNGTLIVDTSGFVPFSVITYYSLVAPRANYEQVMRQVFVPIQWQLLRRDDGASSTVTPTP